MFSINSAIMFCLIVVCHSANTRTKMSDIKMNFKLGNETEEHLKHEQNSINKTLTYEIDQATHAKVDNGSHFRINNSKETMINQIKNSNVDVATGKTLKQQVSYSTKQATYDTFDQVTDVAVDRTTNIAADQATDVIVDQTTDVNVDQTTNFLIDREPLQFHFVNRNLGNPKGFGSVHNHTAADCSWVYACTSLYLQGNCSICECETHKLLAYCFKTKLSGIPQDLPRNISYLVLQHNELNDTALYPRVFANYSDLEVLEIKHNYITALPAGVFEGLNKLVSLNLQRNRIAMDSQLNDSQVFSPLGRTLTTLILNGNNPNTTNPDLKYPDFALSYLPNLSNLALDGLRNKVFGRYFRALKKLTNLTLAGYYPGSCRMTALKNDTFRHVIHVKYLNISECGITGSFVEKDAFAPLTQLVFLDLTNNFELGLEAVGDMMYGLRNSKSIHRLKIERIVSRFTPCVVVYGHTLRYFWNTSIQVIEAMYNEIEMIEQKALLKLPPTLRSLNLTNNKIMFGSYWKDMGQLINLENLHLDGFFMPVEFPYIFPDRRFHCQTPQSIDKEVTDNEKQGSCGDQFWEDNQTDFKLPLPPVLKRMTMRSFSMAYVVTNITFCPNNALEYVDVSSNNFPKLIGPVTGLVNLKVLNLSSSYIETISAKFFNNLTSLEHLSLFQNLLGDCLNNDKNGLIFSQLTDLKVLNLSFNNLYYLGWGVFQGQADIEVIDLSVNRLDHITFNVTHMRKLRHLDLHKNDIQTLPTGLTDHISSLLERGVNVTLDMRQNPISCGCENLDFLQWVVNTRVFGSDLYLYYCKFPDSDRAVRVEPGGYEDVVKRLVHSCSSQAVLYTVVSCVTLLIMLILLAAVIYRFRWTLRYWYHAAKLKISSNQQMDSDQFKYDVFVCYASKDIDFVVKELCPRLKERNITVYVHGEKFKVGCYIADNIYTGIRKCRKTLVVVTQNMLASRWCNYELQIAREQARNTGRNVLVFLFLEELPTSRMGMGVLTHIKSSTYIMYPKLPQHRGAFWDKLADDLRSS
ncbi:toll-like receptor 4 [Biomphalaria glabrata]|uniref:Toll-like receptor 4 n=1 Tax=Biomphalaria glabrata TaxID=6526 RepID=A0A9W2ZJN9_BIOGL|nr:toll-like receptor 4 [Biomphalaria glabrata]